MNKSSLPTKTDAALIFTNDDFLETSRTMYYFGMACRRVNVRPFVRDIADDKWLNEFLDEKGIKDAKDIANLMIHSKYIPFVYYAGIDRIVSFDTQWLLTPECFLELDPIKYILSFWKNDLKKTPLQKTLFHPKVRHFFSSVARLKEAECAGFLNIQLFKPAAPAEFLNENNECIHKDRLGFWPSFSPPIPSSAATEVFKQNPNLEILRQIAKEEILKHPSLNEWKKSEPQIGGLIADVAEAKMKAPYESASELIFQKEAQYPRAFAKLKEMDALFEGSALVKSVFKYDMPAIACRLYRLGCLDVFDEAKSWELYGVQTKGNVKSRDIVSFYQSYIGHLYVPDVASEETLHERLFEIAACGRCVFALNNPDLKECFDLMDEMIAAENLEELEQKISEKLRQPDDLFARGEKARKKISNEHTWDHRLKEFFR